MAHINYNAKNVKAEISLIKIYMFEIKEQLQQMRIELTEIKNMRR